VFIYLAAVASEKASRAVGEVGYKHLLLSYDESPGAWRLNQGLLLDPSARLMVDSGAYTAWTQGKEIDLESYAEFCRGLMSCAGCRVDFVNLDVIPGRPARRPGGGAARKAAGAGRAGEARRRPTPEEVEQSARRGWKNLEKIRSLGVPAMPVFHQFESFHWLERMLDSYDYIGISPSNDEVTDSKFNWLQDVFALLVGRTRLVRTHAFGATADRLLLGFPFYSADSTTWQNPLKYGELLKVALRRGPKGMKWLAQVKKLARPPGATEQEHRGWVESLEAIANTARNPSLVMAHILQMYGKDTFQSCKLGVEAFAEYQRFLTGVWAQRGVDWGE
jgi:hypothetical protein